MLTEQHKMYIFFTVVFREQYKLFQNYSNILFKYSFEVVALQSVISIVILWYFILLYATKFQREILYFLFHHNCLPAE